MSGVLFMLHSEHLQRAAFFLRHAGYSVQPSSAHPRRYFVGDIEPPYQPPAALPATTQLDPPIALELGSEDMMGVIVALQSGGFRVFALLNQLGRYLVEDVYLQGAHTVEPEVCA